jgi:hypothetical protein
LNKPSLEMLNEHVSGILRRSGFFKADDSCENTQDE